MAHSQRRAVPVLLATALVVFGVTACGSDDTAASPETSSSTTADASETEASPSTDETETETTDDSASGSSSEDAKAFISHFTQGLDAVDTAAMTLVIADGTGPTIEMAGVVDYTQDPIAMTMTMTLPSPEDPSVMMDSIALDGLMWINLGERSQNKWVEATGMTEPNDPVADMRAFSQAITDVVAHGPVDLDGVVTEHYSVSIDPKLMPAGELEPGTMLPDTITYEIYLDTEGRPAGLDIDLMGTSVETRLTNFNEPVSIEAPPADQIISFEEMQGQG